MNKRYWIILIAASSLLFSLGMTGQVLAGRNHNANVSVEVVSDQRGTLTKYDAGFRNRKAQRSYVIARDNERYSLRIKNRSNERIGVVIAVDGRNIISGRKSHLKSHERMYILGPYESAEYDGWRTGRNRVNRFYFTGMNDSYAAAWGDYSAMGVIAVAVYKSRHQDIYQYKDRNKTRPFGGPRANARKQDPGTGFGETEWSPSRVVHFEPQNRPAAKTFIKYEWRSTLCKRGVINCSKKKMQGRENRFWPEHNRGLGYAPFPPKWRYR